MLFASKIIKDQTLQIKAQGQKIKLLITNISLDPQSTNALLYLCLPQNQQQRILIVTLQKQRLQTYHSHLQLSLQQPFKLIALAGTVHIIGSYQQIPTNTQPNNQNSHKNTNQSQTNEHKSAKKQSAKKVKQKKKSSSEKPKKWPALMQSIKKQLQEDEDDDDDQSYSVQQDQQSQSDSEEEKQQPQAQQKLKINKKAGLQKKKSAKKEANWATLLLQKDESQDSQDDDYSQQSEQESEESQQNQQKIQQPSHQKRQTQINQKDTKIKNSRILKIPRSKNIQPEYQAIRANENSKESDSFEYKMPSDLPDFLTKNNTNIIL